MTLSGRKEDMGLFRRRHSNSQPVQAPSPVARPDAQPGSLQVAVLGGEEDLRVVGTSFHQENLRQLVGKNLGGKPVRAAVTALLVAEDANPHDRNAVAVWIDGLQVGHLAREDATRYRPGLLALQQSRQRPVALRGSITSGGPERLGVLLHHDPTDFGLTTPATAEARDSGALGLTATDIEDARLAHQSNYNHRFMNCGRGSAEIVTVTGTSRFQQALRHVAATPRPWRHEYDKHLPAVLARVPGNREAVAVLIDGLVTGYLRSEDADQHREQLDELERSVQYLVSSALIVGGKTARTSAFDSRSSPASEHAGPKERSPRS
jgi:hypothetical protein